MVAVSIVGTIDILAEKPPSWHQFFGRLVGCVVHGDMSTLVKRVRVGASKSCWRY